MCGNGINQMPVCSRAGDRYLEKSYADLESLWQGAENSITGDLDPIVIGGGASPNVENQDAVLPQDPLKTSNATPCETVTRWTA